VADPLKNVISDVNSNINKLPDVLNTKIGDPIKNLINNTRKETETQIKGVESNLQSKVVDPITKGILESTSAIKSKIDTSISKSNELINQVNGLETKIISGLDPIKQSIISSAQDVKNKINSSIDTTNNIFNKINDTTGNILNEIYTLDSRIIDPITRLVLESSSKIENTLKPLTNLIEESKTKVEGGLREVVDGTNLVVSKIDIIGDKISQLPDILKENTNFVNAKINDYSNIVNAKLNDYSNTLNVNLNLATNTINSNLNNTTNLITDKLNLATNTINSNLNLATNSINDLPNILRDQLIVFSEILKKQYYEIENKVEDGFNDKILPVLKQVGDELEKAIRTGLGILSFPSKLLQSIVDLLLDPTFMIIGVSGFGLLLLDRM
jgi:predicted PurR-regulated permease PerM